MSIIVTVEYTRDLDLDARETVQVRQNVYTAEEVTAEQVEAALRAFREAMAKVPVTA